LRRLSVWTLLAALVVAGGALADEPTLSPLPPPAAAPIESSLDDVMKADAACQAFTNECEICKRADTGPQCSTPGPVCQPKAWRCDDAK
jgi:hypothetical protein